MNYFEGRPMLYECEDFVEVGYRPKGEENWDTRHLSVWVDRFAFMSELAKWEVDNRDLSEEEIDGAILAWDMTHVPQERMLEVNMVLKAQEKELHRVYKIVGKHQKEGLSKAELSALRDPLLAYFLAISDDSKDFTSAELRERFCGFIGFRFSSDADCSAKTLEWAVDVLNAEMPFLKANPLSVEEMSECIEQYANQENDD